MISIMFDVQQGKWFKVNFSIYLISFGVTELKKVSLFHVIVSLFVLFCTTLMSYFATIERRRDIITVG
jgi:hypothetical protein